jgi:hypothetical protein
LFYFKAMMISPNLMRALIVLCMLGMVLIAAFFLRRRGLSPLAYASWGMLALLLPLVGPFLVIWIHPGQRPKLHPQQ